MSPRRFALCALLAAAPASAQRRASPRPVAPAPAPADPNCLTCPLEPPGFALRPIDRATVRVLAYRGAGAEVVQGHGDVTRLVASPVIDSGSGVVVSPSGVILTARHVLEGADVAAVIFPGQRVPVPAELIASDPAHDVAFLAIRPAAPVRDVVALPTAPPTLTSGQRVSISGYPLTAVERYPAAVAGEFARLNNDGRIQLSVSVNGGNSGGPVLDADGNLLGVVSMRGDPTQGVEGLSIVESVSHAIALWRDEAARAPAPTFGPRDEATAWALGELLRLEPARAVLDAEARRRLLATSLDGLRPEVTVLFAALFWNAGVAELEAASVGAGAVPAATQPLFTAASTLLQRAAATAPWLHENHPFLRYHLRTAGALVVAPRTTVQRSDEGSGTPQHAALLVSDPAEGPAAPWQAGGLSARRPVLRLEMPTLSGIFRVIEPHVRGVGAPDPRHIPVATLRVRLDAQGAITDARVHQATGDARFDASLDARLQAMLATRPRAAGIPPGELASFAGRDLYVPLSFQR